MIDTVVLRGGCAVPPPGNHKNIFSDAGVPWAEYRYFEPKSIGLDFAGMIEDIKVPPLRTDEPHDPPNQ